MREYVYYPGSFQPLALLTQEAGRKESWHYHCDPNGAPVRLTSLQGEIVWSEKTGVWGEKGEVYADRISNPLRFLGQYFDAETGLHYNRHRYYDPEIAGFISQDPIGLAGGLNVYQYAPNPLGWVDPWGLAKCKAPDGYKEGDVDPHGNLSPGVNRAPGHTNSKSDGFVQSHHPIQDAWAKRRINSYQRNTAPATLLRSASGSPHANISSAQRTRRALPGGWDTTLKQEFHISIKK